MFDHDYDDPGTQSGTRHPSHHYNHTNSTAVSESSAESGSETESEVVRVPDIRDSDEQATGRVYGPCDWHVLTYALVYVQSEGSPGTV